MSVSVGGLNPAQALFQTFGAAQQSLRSAGQTVASGAAHLGTVLSGALSVAKAEIGQAASAVREASAQRLSQLANNVTAAARAAAAVPLAVAGKVEAFIEARQAAKQMAAEKLQAAAEQRDMLRSALGRDDPAGILHRTIVTADHPGGATIDQLMDAYHDKLTDPALTKAHTPFTEASRQEMKTFTRVGESIVKALATWDGQLPLTTTVDGQKITIPSNLDTARAVSWFLQAKAMVDNADAGRPNVDLGSGAMIVKDPGNKLYKFLGSADNCYGRYSSHFKKSDRADHDFAATPNSTPGFTKFALETMGKQKLQNGIEDFTNKFPSNGGTLLFDKLKDESTRMNGAPGGELFLKFESVGMPDALWGSAARHGDVKEEKAGFGQAFSRCFHHGINFMGPKLSKIPGLSGIVEAKNQAIMGRGEQIDKLVDKEKFVGVYNDELAKSKLSSQEKKDLKGYDTSRILIGLNTMLASEPDSFTRTLLEGMRTELQQAIVNRGADLGIAREGGEVHVTLG